MKPVLTIVPQGGLCNRLRVVLSALNVFAGLEKPVCVEWGSDKECRARFDELFEAIDVPNLSITERPWHHLPVSRRNLHIPGIVRRLCYGKQQKNFQPEIHGSLIDFARSAKRAYVSSGYTLCDYPPELPRSLRPVAEIRRMIAETTAHFAPNTVGVHIRRTDNSVSIDASPLEAFIEAMRAEVAADPDVRFFLATDDKDVKAELCAIFPGRIISREAPVRRDTLEGMREAVADLYCLAATGKLLGSYWSSFTDTAAELGGMPLHIIRTKQQTQTIMNKHLVFAATNAHKLSEIKAILGDMLDILSLADIDCRDDIPETADTLEGNALLKARWVKERYGYDCFADDTGLEVEALDGGPGVHTARYAYPDRHDPEANTRKLLAELKDKSNRRARFRTAIAYLEGDAEHLFEGIVNGEIATEERGTEGFGYDPVFIPEATGKTFAELGVDVKNDISHRARAVKKLCAYLSART